MGAINTKIRIGAALVFAFAAAMLISATALVATSTQGAAAQGGTCQGQEVTVDLSLGQLPTAGADVILGTSGDDLIAAMDGDDVICGEGGNDSIWGQGGNDSIDGGEGDDRLRGGAADDSLFGGPGSDDIAGGPGDDVVDGGDGDDTALRGGGGDDQISGGAGDDALLAGNGGVDNLNGGPGNDKVTGGPRPDELAGGDGDDELRGHKGADEMAGGPGNDALFGGPQPDALDGGSGADICNGGTTGSAAIEGDVARNCESHLFVENVFSGRSAALEALGGCEEYLAHMKSVAAERVGPYGIDGVFGGPIFLEEGIPIPALPVDAQAPPQPAPAPGGEASADALEFSDTNNQVAGVDEPDIIKTDGRRIVAVHDSDVRIFTINGSDATQVGSITLDSAPRELVLDGDRVLVIGDRWRQLVQPIEPIEPGLIIEPGIADQGLPFVPHGESVTVITQLDISAAPTVLGQLELEGNYVSARKIGGVVRLVVSSEPRPLPFTYPMGQDGTQAAIDKNLKVVDESTLDDWLGEYTLLSASGAEVGSGPLVPCERIYRPDAFSGFGVLAVLTVDMAGDLTPGRGTGVITDGQTVYASQNSLYVSTTLWPSFPINGGPQIDIVEFEENYQTALHRFDIADPTTANYVASGLAEGSLLNQFSLHEHDDRLFVATTQGSPWGANANSESFITTLEVSGDTLTEVGKVGEMGRGERIFAVRFIDATAYVVTFRQVDPLYVVDLRDPTAPVVTGELKIPGYSAYLHPVGDGLLLGVGQDATDEGRITGAKVSLFDVSDPTAPIERSVWTAPDSFSDAEWDHRAFLYWPADNLAVLPITQYEQQWAGAIALRVTAEGITEIARIDHAPVGGEEEPSSTCRRIEPEEQFFGPGVIFEVCGPNDESSWPGYFCDRFDNPIDIGFEIELAEGEYLHVCWPDGSSLPPQIRRTLVIGDSLWSMSHRYLQSNDLTTFERTGRQPF